MRPLREIGGLFPWHVDSEFDRSAAEQVQFANLLQSSVLTGAGRSSIDLALSKLQLGRDRMCPPIVYFPSYCCQSMLDPFIRWGFEFKFYNVILSNGGDIHYEIDEHADCDLFYATSYFGVESTSMADWIKNFESHGIPVIEDKTHSIFSARACTDGATYSFASLRKWLGVASGSLLIGAYPNPEPGQTSIDDSIDLASLAMEMKATYLTDQTRYSELKKFSLKMESIHKQLLERQYPGLGVDSRSADVIANLDVVRLENQRRANARVLVNGLRDLGLSNDTIAAMNLDTDVPLFVPLFLETEERDRIARSIRSEGVYAPIHWPLPKLVEQYASDSEGTLRPYSSELSIPCDQRYDDSDMQYILEVIERFI